MAKLTTFGVGGRAAHYLQISEPAELVRAVQKARQLKIPFHLIAGGSNVVFGDKNFAGLVVHFVTPSNSRIVVKKTTLEVSAGLALKSLITSSIKNNLAGLEALSGIPGSVGGAIVGNAGAYGQGISDHLVSVQIWDGKKVKWIRKPECDFTYRESVFKKRTNWLVLRAKFKLKLGNKTELLKKSREIIRVRSAKYHPKIKCPGSFFKNILLPNGEKIVAGRLLEQVGACGMKMGKIEVASFHGNLLINRGGGKFSDVQTLANLLKKKVYQKFGIKLEEEVRYLT